MKNRIDLPIPEYQTVRLQISASHRNVSMPPMANFNVDCLDEKGEQVHSIYVNKTSGYINMRKSDLLLKDLITALRCIKKLKRQPKDILVEVSDLAAYLYLTNQTHGHYVYTTSLVKMVKGALYAYGYPFTIKLGDPEVAKIHYDWKTECLYNRKSNPTREMLGYTFASFYEEQMKIRRALWMN